MDSFAALRDELTQLEANTEGVAMADVLMLPAALRKIFRRLIRTKKVSLSELVEALGLSAAETQILGNILVEKGFLQPPVATDSADLIYYLNLSAKSTNPMAGRVWDVLEDL